MTRIRRQGTKIDVYSRDVRIHRALRDLTTRCTITRLPDISNDYAWFDVVGGTMPYVIGIDLKWSERPTCTCPDAKKRALKRNGGFCRHIIAVLLNEPDFRYQLLEMFL